LEERSGIALVSRTAYPIFLVPQIIRSVRSCENASDILRECRDHHEPRSQIIRSAPQLQSPIDPS